MSNLKPGTGILWFRDNPNRSLKDDIEWCKQKFIKKFGVQPNVLNVAESELGLYSQIESYEIVPMKNIGDSYFWMTRKVTE